MTNYKLPDGFMWLTRTGDAMPFVHTESGMSGRVSSCIVRVLNDESIQSEIYRSCAKLLREVAMDDLWRECGGNREEFDRRRSEVIA